MRTSFVRDRLFIACGVGASVALSAVLATAGTRGEGVEPGEEVSAPVALEAPAAPGGMATRVVGVVVPVTQVAVRARVDGFISRRLKAPGNRVAAGEAVSLVDDTDLLIERDKCNARAEAAAHRCEAAGADLRALERWGEQLRATRAARSATPFELTQNQCQVEAAAARLKALEGECKEAAADCTALERRIRNCVCVAPVDGRLGEALRVEGDYVRTGDPVAVVESLGRQIRVTLPASLAERARELSFHLAGAGIDAPLSPAKRLSGEHFQAGRSVALEIPPSVELELGRTVDVEVVSP
jgi:multidrug efflux pump subunit AcrA (membrane-fusion protein)